MFTDNRFRRWFVLRGTELRLFVLGIALAICSQFALSSTASRGEEPAADYKTALDEALESIDQQRPSSTAPKIGDEENDYGDVANQSLDDFDGWREHYDVDSLIDRLLSRYEVPTKRVSAVLRDLERRGDDTERDHSLGGHPFGRMDEGSLGFGGRKSDLAGPPTPPPGAGNSDRRGRFGRSEVSDPRSRTPQGADGVPEQRPTFSRDRSIYPTFGDSATERRRFDSYQFSGTVRPFGGRSYQTTIPPGARVGPPNPIGAQIGPANPYGR